MLAGVPLGLRKELFDAYRKIERNFRESRWEPSELNGGKLCEVVYSILNGHFTGNFPASASKPNNMVDACRALESAGATFPRSMRIQIPRMLVALYEIRNNRGVGHVGGEVNPNFMDAICVLHTAKWIMCELIRVFHNLSTEEAARVIDVLSDRELTLIWKINGVSRILDNSLSMTDKTLALLYGSTEGVHENDLTSFVEHSNKSIYRRDVLRRLHKKRLIEYDSISRTSVISPLGVRHVEEKILKQGWRD